MIKAGIIGATGYSGQELADLLSVHPEVEISYLTARFDKCIEYGDVYPRFRGRVDAICEKFDPERAAEKCDVVFLALPHTVSMNAVPELLKQNVKVIDLSGDYRLPREIYEKWYGKIHTDPGNIDKAVYGLPEMNRDSLPKADLVSNPGCYPTSVILALKPVIADINKAGARIVVDSKSGASGAGRKASFALSFCEVDGNFKCYKANEHQHMPEMEHILGICAGGEVKVNFAPHLLPVNRGILSTIYVPAEGMPSEKEIRKIFEAVYSGEPFVRVCPDGDLPELRNVVHTNYCDIGLKLAGGMLIIVSVIDNLIKGASGQAVQNMNIMMGLDEGMGLK